MQTTSSSITSTEATGPPIVLLHGFTTTLVGNWERPGWIDLLARNGFRVVRPRFRSHGRSQRVYDPRECETDALTSDVVSLLNHLRVPHDVFGFSMGAGVALSLAMTRAERVRRIVLGGIADAALNEHHDPLQIAELRAAGASDSSSFPASSALRLIRRALGDLIFGGGVRGQHRSLHSVARIARLARLRASSTRSLHRVSSPSYSFSL